MEESDGETTNPKRQLHTIQSLTLAAATVTTSMSTGMQPLEVYATCPSVEAEPAGATQQTTPEPEAVAPAAEPRPIGKGIHTVMSKAFWVIILPYTLVVASLLMFRVSRDSAYGAKTSLSLHTRMLSYMHGMPSLGARRETTNRSPLCASYSAGRSHVDVPGRDSPSPRKLHNPQGASRCPRCSRSWHPPRRLSPASRVAPPPICARHLLSECSSIHQYCVAAYRFQPNASESQT